MNIKEHKSNIRTVRPGDPDFKITDGMIVYPRAMLHILPECPRNVRETLQWAHDNGYIKCIANMYDSERMWEVLNDR